MTQIITQQIFNNETTDGSQNRTIRKAYISPLLFLIEPEEIKTGLPSRILEGTGALLCGS